jgi:hypothetical protein
VERTKHTIEVWNICTCGRKLFSMAEGKRGTCSSCWFKAMPADTKSAMNKLLAAVFKPTSDAEKDKLIDDAMTKLDRDRSP